MTKPSAIRSADDSMPYGINFMLYSDPGVGKTPLIATAPNTLILDTDLGSESAAGSPGVDIWPIDNWPDLESAHEYLRHEDHGYKWVWMDGISVGQDRLLTNIMEELVAVKDHRKMWQADKAEYGQNMFRMKQWIQNMTALPFNFGITSHPWRFEDPVTEEEVILPWIQGKNMPQNVCGMMNVIGYLTLDDDGKQKLYTKPNNGYYARDKFRALGAGMINPTIPKIEAKIREAIKARSGKPTPTKARRASKTTTRRK